MNQKRNSPLFFVLGLLFVLVVPFFPLLLSGRWDWWEAWTFALISVLGFAVSRVLMARKHPGLIEERTRFKGYQNVEAWDRILAPLFALGSGLIPLAAGLDALGNGFQAFGLTIKIMALVLIIFGYVLGTYAMLANRFFSSLVRIQTERGHQVVSNGPYCWIRHPGYAGAFCAYLAAPFLLGSLWAFPAVAFLTIALIIRTWREDRFLQQALPGYRDYAKQVRYRLLPGIW